MNHAGFNDAEKNSLDNDCHHQKRSVNVCVATYPSTGVRVKSQRSIFQKGKRVGVTTNVYLRKTLGKPKRRFVNFENKGSGVVYTWGRY